jgi:hypothetical protein
VKTGHWRAERTDWDYSGWRGMGYYEFVSNLDGEFTVEHEVTRPRHRVLRALGLPSALLDPYPLYWCERIVCRCSGTPVSAPRVRLASGR